MCLMLTKPANVKLNKAALQKSYTSNRDGSGFAAADKSGHMYVFRSHDIGFEEFYEKLMIYEDCALLVHFRNATSGGVNWDNTHPFVLDGNNYAMAHNGIIRVENWAKESDTRAFIRKAITPYLEKYPKLIESEKWQRYAKEAIGGWNKLAFLSKQGEFFYVNKDQGVEDLGCWWSNSGYKVYTNVTGHWNYHRNSLHQSHYDDEYELAEEIYKRQQSRRQIESQLEWQRQEDERLAETMADADDEELFEDDLRASELSERDRDEARGLALDFLLTGSVLEIEDSACCVCNNYCEPPYYLDTESGWTLCKTCQQTYAPGFVPLNQDSEPDDDDQTLEETTDAGTIADASEHGCPNDGCSGVSVTTAGTT